MENKLNEVASKLADAGYDMTTRVDMFGDTHVVATNGSLVTTVSIDGDRLYMVMYVDYGDDGTSFDSNKHLKTVPAVVKTATNFLGKAKH